MITDLHILVFGYILGFYMSWNIGANDVANSMASAVGAKAITIRQAVVIAGVLNIVGATFIGSHVTNTIRKGIVSTEVLNDPHLALIGALSAMLAAALWVSFATFKSLPVSTTHSIVGAMIGFGLMAAEGKDVINWGKLGAVVLSWVISPLFSLLIAFVMFKVIVKLILSRSDPTHRALRYSPFFIGLTLFVVVLSFLFKTPLGKTFSMGAPTAVSLALLVATLGGLAGRGLIQKFMNPQTRDAEAIFRRIQVGTSCYVALAQGANDVANAIGPLAMVYFLVKSGQVGAQVSVPVHLLLFGGVGIACGIGMAGYRVMHTLGHQITTLSNTRGFAVDFAAATTVLVASKLGLPVSTTHAAVGGVMGVGLARGIEAVNFRVILKIMVYWVLTVPAAAITSMVVFKILQHWI